MIDFSKLTKAYVDGYEIKTLFLDGHEVPVGEETPAYFTVIALEAPCTVTISKTGSPTASIEYSTGGDLWASYVYGTGISLASVGSKVMFRASSLNSTFSVDDSNYYRFNASAKYRLSGDIMSLLDPQLTTDVVPGNCFIRLFIDNRTLSSVEGLKIGAKTIEGNGFNEAFFGCTGLVDASGFDISGIENVSGGGMWGFFQDCTSLTASPLMPNLTATNWDARTFFFRSCTHLSSISTLQTTWGDDNGGAYWIDNVPKTDKQKFFCPSALGTDSTIQRGDTHRCPDNWLVGNFDVDGSLMSNAFTRGSYTTAYVYDGNNHMPSMADISVHNGQTTELLVQNTDYVIYEPEDLSSIGTKTVTFTGMGTYTGSLIRTYKIVDGDISRCTIELGTAYDNEGPTSILVWSNDLQQYLIEDTDFIWTYQDSTDTCTATVEGIGNWHGTKTATVARKDSGTTPLAVYKHDSNDSNNVYVKLANFQGGPDVLIDKKPMSDPTASWSQLGTSYASDSVGFWLRARSQNERMGWSDWEYKWIDCGYDQNNAAQVDLSGDIASLLDRSQTSLSSTLQSSVFNSTFQNNDKIVDASRLSCSMKSFDSEYGIRRLFGSRDSGNGAMSGRPQALTAMPMLEGLSVNTRNGYAYIANFQGCTSLSSAMWQIPWAMNPYNSWDDSTYIGEQEFRDCTQLRDVVISSHFGDGRLCEDSLMSQAKFLNRAFQGCRNLTCISTDISAWPANGFPDWVSGVAATGTFICPEALGTDATIQRGESYCPTGWTVVNYDAALVPLKFTAQQSNSTVALSALGTPPSVSLLKSTDGETWTSYTVNDTVTLANVGDYVMLKADQPNSRFASSNSNYSQFLMTGRISAEGDIMSLLDGGQKTSTISSERCFQNLFAACSQLTQAPELPATELCSNCYMNMFGGCTSLSTAPELPAETLANECYKHMFRNCTSLISAPALPATALANECYNSMLSGCTSLSIAPALPATTLASNCYLNMFGGCTNLSVAPSLPATVLCSNCYASMFNGCSSLSAMDVKFTAWSPSNATQNWLSGVAATGTFTCKNDLDTTLSDASHVPAGWTVVNQTIQYADYVQTNGYVLDTLYKPTVNTSLSTCLSGSANGNCFIGFNYDNDQQDYRLFNLDNWLYFDMGNGRIYTTSGWDTSKWTDISAWNFGFKFTQEGGSERTTTGTVHSAADWDANGTFNIAGNGYGANCDMCIKYLKIYESDVLVRDFKAAVDANGVAGLYDEVQGVFYYPTGSRVWTAYGVVTPTPSTPTPGDRDGDGYTDSEEVAAGTNPNDPNDNPGSYADSDGDGFSNAMETAAGSDPLNPYSTPNDVDSDEDGWGNGYEINVGTDPEDPTSTPDDHDADEDGVPDAIEIDEGTDPNDPDSYPGSDDPFVIDSDGDGYTDGDEINNGTDPNDPDSYPGSEEPEEEP